LSSPFPAPDGPLTDGVVSLRAWDEADIPDLVVALQDPDIPRFTRIPSPYTEAHAREFLSGRAGEERSFAIVEAPDVALLGGIGLRDAGEARGEVGYWVRTQARGRGVAMRALRLIARWAFDELALARLQLLTRTDNPSSQRAAERAGFRREGVLRSYMDFGEKRYDGVMFGLVPADLDGERGSDRE
jgi:RimJ/RimL family protein N-acetyltransferase